MRRIASVLLLLVCASPVRAQGQGIVMTQRETRDGQSTTNRVQMDRTHIRAEARNGGEQLAFVYDGAGDVARMINLDKKSYLEMTREQVRQMGQQLNSALAMMQAQMANMPPEQRAMVERMMRGRGGAAAMPGAAPAKTTYRRTGAGKVGQWTCTNYEGFRGPDKILELCTVSPADLGLSAADFEVTRKLGEFFASLMPQAAEQMSVLGTADDQGFVGFPVRRTSFRNGVADSVNELTELRRENLPSSVFAVPEGFRREATPGAR